MEPRDANPLSTWSDGLLDICDERREATPLTPVTAGVAVKPSATTVSTTLNADKENLHCNSNAATPGSQKRPRESARRKFGALKRITSPAPSGFPIPDTLLQQFELASGGAPESEPPRQLNLREGEVVCLALGGQLLRAVPTGGQLLEFEVDPASEAWSSTSLGDPASQLTVVRSYGWVGFRSSCGKLLQAKRKGLSRYGFYSTKFGVLEQWTVEPEPHSDQWSSVQVMLKNRHHGAIEIRVELIRVPKHIVPLYGIVPSPSFRSSISASHSTLRYSTPSSPRGSISRRRSGASLPAAMSTLLVSQWTDFVEKELEERRTIEEAVQEMHTQVLDIRASASAEIINLRSEAAAAVREVLQDSRDRMRSRLARRAAYWELRSRFCSWRDAVSSKAARRARHSLAVNKQLQRSSHRLALAALEAWRDTAALRASERAHLARSVEAAVSALLGSVFHAWREEASVVVSVPRLLSVTAGWSLSRRAVLPLELPSDQAPIELAIDHMRRRSTLRLSELSFLAWRDWAQLVAAAESLAATTRRRHFKGVLFAWRAAASREVELRAAAEAANTRQRRRSMARALWQWWLRAGHKASRRSAVAGAQLLARRRLLGRSFLPWAESAKASSRQRASVEQFVWNISRSIVRSALEGWREVVKTKVQQRSWVERCLREASAAKTLRLLCRALNGWADEAMVGSAGDAAAEKVKSFRRKAERLSLTAALMRWRRAAALGQDRAGAFRASLQHLSRRWERLLVADCVESWRQWSFARAEALRQGQKLSDAAARRGVARALAEWRRLVKETAAEEDRAVAAASRVSMRRLLAAAMGAWAQAAASLVAMRGAVARFQAEQRLLSCGRAMEAWREASRAPEGTGAVSNAHERVSVTRLLRRYLFCWYAVLLSTTAAAQAFCNRARSGAALKAWATAVRLSAQLREAAGEMAHRGRLAAMEAPFQEWRTAATRSRHLKKKASAVWTRLVATRRRERDAEERAEALAQTGVTSKAFAAWRWAMTRSSERSAAAEAHGRRQAASSGLRRWREAVADTAQWRKASRMHERAAVAAAWRAWNDSLALRRLRATAEGNRRSWVLRGALEGLRRHSAASKRDLEQLSNARSSLRRRGLLRRLRAWGAAAKLQRATALSAECRHWSRVLAAAAAAWRDQAALLAAARAAAPELGTRAAARRCLVRWRAAASALRDAVEATLLCQRRRLLLVLGAWASVASSMAATKAGVSRLRSQARTRMVRSVLASWSLATARSRWISKVLASRCLLHDAAALSSALRVWEDNARALRVLRREVDRRVFEASRNAQSVAWSGWWTLVERERASRRLLGRCCRRLAHRRLGGCFGAWREAAARVSGARRLCGAFRASMELRTLGNALAGWSELRLLSLRAQRLVARITAKRLRGVLDAWRKEAAAGARVLEALGVAARAVRRAGLEAAWRLWLGATRTSGAAAAALTRSLAARASQRLLRLAFAAWASASAASSQAASTAAVLGASKRRAALLEALWAWRAAASESKEALGRIRSCVAAKRVAQEQFLEWYADAFEEEISGAAELLFGSCGSSIGAAFQHHPAKLPSAVPLLSFGGQGDHAEPTVACSLSQELGTLSPQPGLRIPRSLAMNLQDSAASSSCSDDSSDEGSSFLRDTLTFEKLAALSARSALMLEASATPSAAALTVPGKPAAEEEDDDGVSGPPGAMMALLPGVVSTPAYGNPLFARAAGNSYAQSFDNSSEGQEDSPLCSRPGYEPASAMRKQAAASGTRRRPVSPQSRTGSLMVPMELRFSVESTPLAELRSMGVTHDDDATLIPSCFKAHQREE